VNQKEIKRKRKREEDEERGIKGKIES